MMLLSPSSSCEPPNPLLSPSPFLPPLFSSPISLHHSKLQHERQQLEEDAAAVQQLLLDVAQQQQRCVQVRQSHSPAGDSHCLLQAEQLPGS